MAFHIVQLPPGKATSSIFKRKGQKLLFKCKWLTFSWSQRLLSWFHISFPCRSCWFSVRSLSTSADYSWVTLQLLGVCCSACNSHLSRSRGVDLCCGPEGSQCGKSSQASEKPLCWDFPWAQPAHPCPLLHWFYWILSEKTSGAYTD